MIVYFIVTAAGMLLFAVAAVFLVLLVRGGQLDDLDTPPIRMLHDDHEVRDRTSQPAAPAGEHTKDLQA